MNERSEVYVVDRLEGTVMILVAEDGEAVELHPSMLPPDVGEGAVLRVPLDPHGAPMWTEAARDRDMEAQLLDQARRRLERLKNRDPGGDVVL